MNTTKSFLLCNDWLKWNEEVNDIYVSIVYDSMIITRLPIPKILTITLILKMVLIIVLIIAIYIIIYIYIYINDPKMVGIGRQ